MWLNVWRMVVWVKAAEMSDRNFFFCPNVSPNSYFSTFPVLLILESTYVVCTIISLRKLKYWGRGGGGERGYNEYSCSFF